MEIVFLTGIMILSGTFAGKVFQRFKIPQIVGYMIVRITEYHPLVEMVNRKILERQESLDKEHD